MTGFSRPSIRLLHPTELEQALLIDESDFPANALQEPSLIEPAEKPGDSFQGKVQVVCDISSRHGQIKDVCTQTSFLITRRHAQQERPLRDWKRSFEAFRSSDRFGL